MGTHVSFCSLIRLGFKWFAFVYPTPVCAVAADGFLSDGMFFGRTGFFFSMGLQFCCGHDRAFKTILITSQK